MSTFSLWVRRARAAGSGEREQSLPAGLLRPYPAAYRDGHDVPEVIASWPLLRCRLVCFWHKADIPIAFRMSAFGGKADMDRTYCRVR
jgi:hypothetical protein